MKKQSIGRMLAATFLLGIFMNIHHPNTPSLFTDLQLPSRIFGTSFAAMCLFSFLTSPFWGEMSDAKGRIKVFMISCVGYGIAQLTLGYSTTELTVLLSRSLAGVFASGTAIASLAYVADLYSDEQRGKGMSIYIAVQSVSLACGYLLGGLLGTISFHFAFLVQGIGMIALGILTYGFLAESLTIQNSLELKALLKTINPLSSFINARFLFTRMLMPFLIAIVLSSFASTCYDNAFNYYLKDQMDFIPAYNGILKAIVGLIGLAANFTLNMWIVAKTNARHSLAVTLLLCGVSAGVGVFFRDYIALFLMFNLVFFTANAVYQPIVQTLSVERRSIQEIGIITGLVNALKSLGNVIGSLLSGMVYDISAVMPFLLAGVFFLFASLFSFSYYRKGNKANPQNG